VLVTRSARRVGTVVLTLAAISYLIWQVDLGTTVDVLRDANFAWFVMAAAIMILTVPVLAARWGWLLGSHDIHAVHRERARDLGEQSGLVVRRDDPQIEVAVLFGATV